jgi:hypothetical protein
MKMQKRILWCSVFTILLAISSAGQTNTFPTSGNVGIGTTSPAAKLDVEGGWSISSGGFYNDTSVLTGINTIGNGTLNFRSGGVDGKMVILSSGQVGIGTLSPVRKLSIQGSGGTTAALAFNNSLNHVPYVGVAYDETNDGLAFMINMGTTDLNTTPLFIQRVAGNVGIGTTNPQYKLSVNGTIQAKEVLVNSGWADYVFRPDYRVRPLAEVAEFIKANHHLPDIPSEKEVKDKGVSLGDMQTKLLAKIEELTLQMIQLDEQNRALAKKVAQLEGR